MKFDKVVLYLSLPLFALLVYVSCIGLFTENFYIAETINWQTQSIGQDMIDLFVIAPTFLFATLSAIRGNKKGFLIWGGTTIYLLYTFTIFCFDVHFNKLFVFYCFVLGLSFYSTLYFFYNIIKFPFLQEVKWNLAGKITGFYLIIISCLFYFLWLSEIIPAINANEIPKNLSEVGLPTNAVHVIDLSIFLPLAFTTGVLLLRKNNFGQLLSVVILAFFVLMDITIGVLTVVMKQKNIVSDITVAYLMIVFAVISLTFLILNLRTQKYIL